MSNLNRFLIALDGVSQWREQGIDPSIFTKALGEKSYIK